MSEKLEGRNPVLEALKSGRTINKILIAKGDKHGSIREIIGLARSKGLVVQEVDRKKLDALAESASHQGIIAFVAPKAYVEVEDILQIAQDKEEPPFLVLLDGVEDPHNLGSILRSADGAGAHGVVIPQRRAVGLTAIVGKTSAGAMEYLPVARITNMAQTIDSLKEQGLWIVGADMDGQEFYYQANLTGPIALVIGGEGKGLGRLVKEKCDFLVRIPMKGRVSSLNAAVAGSLLMYEVSRQRG